MKLLVSSLNLPLTKRCFFSVIDSGSGIKEKCTREKNTVCQCRGEFVPRDSDSSTCKCEIGFGLTNGGIQRITQHCMSFIKEIAFLINHSFSTPECSKCPDGYFSARMNSPCQKHKEYVHCILVS